MGVAFTAFVFDNCIVENGGAVIKPDLFIQVVQGYKVADKQVQEAAKQDNEKIKLNRTNLVRERER
jgi:hypothetical protein